MSDDKEKTLEFIEDYRKLQLLWDPMHRDYTSKIKRNEALAALGRKHNLSDLTIIKNKIKSLRSYFSKERQKVLSKQNEKPEYEPSWFAYKSLLFIGDSMTPIEIKETGGNTLVVEDYSDTASQGENTSEFHEEHKDDVIHVIPTKRRMIEREEESRHNWESSVEQKCNNDEYATFGQLIAHKLRKLSPPNRLLAERRISNVLFNLEVEEIEAASSYSVSSAARVGTPVVSVSGHSSQGNPTLELNPNQNIQMYRDNLIADLKNELID